MNDIANITIHERFSFTVFIILTLCLLFVKI